ncbi:hypothetical protein P3T76_006151 [Phytophthora citrophthora]|uniref:Uncharacterized protein n=1 Tax=Phytophthora citrophthora TaxID=4793 RepID=A0AAD9LPF2_9STRA|nr:hypothetical protein P3T76_006151 [Phytophthora citrophthora]
MKKEQEYERAVTLINSTRYKTHDIVFIPMIDVLDEKDNAITNLPSNVEKFIRSGAPTVEIDPQNVQTIEIEDFHKVSQRLRDMQENLLKENVLLKRKIEEVSKKRNSIESMTDAFLAPNHSVTLFSQDDDNLQTAAGSSTRDSTTETTASVLPKRIGNPQWGEAFIFVPETEAKRVVNTSGCQNWIWADFEMAKNYVTEKLKRPWNKLKNWWKPQQCTSNSSDQDHSQGPDSISISAYSEFSVSLDGTTHGHEVITSNTFPAAQGEPNVDLSAKGKDIVVDISQ